MFLTVKSFFFFVMPGFAKRAHAGNAHSPETKGTIEDDDCHPLADENTHQSIS